MKSEDLYNAVTELRDDQVQAGEKKLRRGRAGDFRRVGAIAAVLAVVILMGVLAGPWLGAQLRRSPEQTGAAPTESTNASTANLNKFSLARASYSRLAPHSVHDLTNKEYVPELYGYLRSSLPTLLSGAGDENRVVSPLNLYVALAMTAETADGQTREELLRLLNAPDLETLRDRTNALWRANYRDNEENFELLASSLWLRNNWSYNLETVNRMAEIYYASVFSGEMGGKDYNETMRAWVNEQTKNLMENQLEGIGTGEDDVMALITATCFQAEWMLEFDPGENEIGVFHGAQGDVSCEYMHGSEYGVEVCVGNGFIAGEKWLKGNGGSMYFVLPDEGVTPEKLLGREDFLSFLCGQEGDKGPERKKAVLYLTVPKYDVSSQLSLNEKLKELGVEEAFDANKANFSPLSSEAEGLYLSEVQHGARLSIDEKGVTGVAFSESIIACAAAEEVYLTLDRPFLFVVTNNEGLPIFVGIVNNPNY